jgi:multicomponent Na+:H+ antiporter subunit D
MVAAFSISGFPLFNGFISKSMIVSAAGEAHYDTAMLLLTLAAVGTFLSVGLKLPYFTWFAKKQKNDVQTKPLPRNMLIGMTLVGFICILHGIAPGLLYKYLPNPVHWQPYTLHHLVETVEILVFTFIGFWILRKLLKPKPTLSLDFDWFYRRPHKMFRQTFVEAVDDLFDRAENATLKLARAVTKLGSNPYLPFTPPTADKTYTPDRYRPALRNMVSAILAVLLLAIIFGLLF